MQLFENFFPTYIKAFMTDRSQDFTLASARVLSEDQREHLSLCYGIKKPEEIGTIRQEHRDKLHIVSCAHQTQEIPFADGIFTAIRHFPISIRTADCLSIYLCDPAQKIIGLVHAGWRSSQLQIAYKAIGKMEAQWQCCRENILVALGPAIKSCCYEVGVEFLNYFPKNVFIEKSGKRYLDLVQVNKNQLLQKGIPEKNIYIHPACTCCHPEFFSFRREAAEAGRHLCLMSMS